MDKKKAELQRKLTLGPVPRPPAGLSRRIKDDIPKYLEVNELERRRMSRSMMLNLRVAASILLLVSGVYVFMQLGERGRVAESFASKEAAAPLAAKAVAEQQQQAAAPAEADVATSAASAPPPAAMNAPVVERRQVQPTFVARAEPTTPGRLSEAPPVAAPAPVPPPPPPAPVPPPPADFVREEAVALADAAEVQAVAEGAETGVSGGIVGGVVGGTAGGVVRSRAETVTASAPMVAAPEPPPAVAQSAPAAAPAAPPPARGFLRSANAAEMKLAGKDSVFGISVDRGAFQRVKSAIERGERPSATAVNVEALVNYFAGPGGNVRREVKLETEASPAPVRADGVCCILRFTVDTGTVAIPAGGSVPPVATDAQIEINLNPNVVTSHRRIGGPNELDAAEPTLLRNTSVTGLYALDLRNGMTPRQRVATVTLRYRSVATGDEHKISQTLYVRDFTGKWSSASRRHRLASLGAVWGETLQRAGAGTDVAQRAEELATEEPKDERARELATWATAASRIGVTSSTGSGR